MKALDDFLDKYYPEGNRADAFNVYGYAVGPDAGAGAEAVRRRSHARERDEAGRQPEGLQDCRLLLPGIKINTSPTDFAPIKQVQLRRFKGDRWELFGPTLGSEIGG